MKYLTTSLSFFLILLFCSKEGLCQTDYDSLLINSEISSNIGYTFPSLSKSEMTHDGNYIIDFKKNIIWDVKTMKKLRKFDNVTAIHPKKNLIACSISNSKFIYDIDTRASYKLINDLDLQRLQFSEFENSIYYLDWENENRIIKYNYVSKKYELSFDFENVHFSLIDFRVLSNDKLLTIKDSDGSHEIYIKIKTKENEILFSDTIRRSGYAKRFEAIDFADNYFTFKYNDNFQIINLKDYSIREVESYSRFEILDLKENLHLYTFRNHLVRVNINSGKRDTVKVGNIYTNIWFEKLGIVGLYYQDSVGFYDVRNLKRLASVIKMKDPILSHAYSNHNKLYVGNRGRSIEFDMTKMETIRSFSSKSIMFISPLHGMDGNGESNYYTHYNFKENLDLAIRKNYFAMPRIHAILIGMYPRTIPPDRAFTIFRNPDGYLINYDNPDQRYALNKFRQIKIYDLVRKDTSHISLPRGEAISWDKPNFNKSFTKMIFRSSFKSLSIYDLEHDSLICKVEAKGKIRGYDFSRKIDTLFYVGNNEGNNKSFLHSYDIKNDETFNKIDYQGPDKFRVNEKEKVIIGFTDRTIKTYNLVTGAYISSKVCNFAIDNIEFTADFSHLMVFGKNAYCIFDIDNWNRVLKCERNGLDFIYFDEKNNFNGSFNGINEVYFLDRTNKIAFNKEYNFDNFTPDLEFDILDLKESDNSAKVRLLQEEGFDLPFIVFMEVLITMNRQVDEIIVTKHSPDSIKSVHFQGFTHDEIVKISRRLNRRLSKYDYSVNSFEQSESYRRFSLVLYPNDETSQGISTFLRNQTLPKSLEKELKKQYKRFDYDFFHIGENLLQFTVTKNHNFLNSKLYKELSLFCGSSVDCFGSKEIEMYEGDNILFYYLNLTNKSK